MLVFSQAREYLPGTGRFAGEDINKGNIMMPDSLNDYSYCLGNPLILVDKNGRSPVNSMSAFHRYNTGRVFFAGILYGLSYRGHIWCDSWSCYGCWDGYSSWESFGKVDGRIR